MSASNEEPLRHLASRYSTVQRRTIDVALSLITERGVAGTSFQMIADALGVTKAAVYHQFRSKDALIVGVLEVHLQELEAVVRRAERAAPSPDARQALLADVIDSVVASRHALSTLQRDPAVARLVAQHSPARQLWVRLFELLLGDQGDERSRVRAAVLSAVTSAASHPAVADIDDETLRQELYAATRLLLTTE